MNTATEQLQGWKEIACYLKRSVRSVQRWERNEGLPVRRHGHARGVSVYAFPQELNAWWENAQRSCKESGRERTSLAVNDESELSAAGLGGKGRASKTDGRVTADCSRRQANFALTACEVTCVHFLLIPWGEGTPLTWRLQLPKPALSSKLAGRSSQTSTP